ncbi:MAG: hypothetical protein A2Y11_06210 [Planctomycetes bacterium GWC2_39_26]|nr:MAG: hypothetical protein A2Y11_06210 [Planctomycetes bacterium GWC2_39_26]
MIKTNEYYNKLSKTVVPSQVEHSSLLFLKFLRFMLWVLFMECITGGIRLGNNKALADVQEEKGDRV